MAEFIYDVNPARLGWCLTSSSFCHFIDSNLIKIFFEKKGYRISEVDFEMGERISCYTRLKSISYPFSTR